METRPLYPKLQDLDLKGKRVLLRVDFNVPLQEGDNGLSVSDPSRILGALETIRYIRDQEGKCILASHLGRPKGKRKPEFSLEPVGRELSTLLETDVVLTEDSVGDGPRSLTHNMRVGDILLLENLRFHPGEEANLPNFANQLAELCDVYINDAFGTLHRAHASTASIASLVESKAIGFLVQKELSYLAPLRESPKRPFALFMGGAKVSDKMALIEHFLPLIDTLAIGGAMAYAFLKAKGYNIGKSLCSPEQVELAARLIKSADAREVDLLLPIDHIVSRDLEDANVQTTTDAHIADEFLGGDIGPKSIELFSAAAQRSETLFWNGPMGVFEKNYFAQGTFTLAKNVSSCSALKLAGGGDVAAALDAAGCKQAFDFISTGGGATLEYLEGKNLPGLKALELSKRSS